MSDHFLQHNNSSELWYSHFIMSPFYWSLFPNRGGEGLRIGTDKHSFPEGQQEKRVEKTYDTYDNKIPQKIFKTTWESMFEYHFTHGFHWTNKRDGIRELTTLFHFLLYNISTFPDNRWRIWNRSSLIDRSARQDRGRGPREELWLSSDA